MYAIQPGEAWVVEGDSRRQGAGHGDVARRRGGLHAGDVALMQAGWRRSGVTPSDRVGTT